MTVSIEDENPHAGDDPSFRDAVTFSFGDPVVQLYGLARLGLGGDGASGFAVVHHGEEIAGSSMETRPESAGAASWDEVRAAGVRSRVITPLEAWHVSYEGGRDAGFDLRFEADVPLQAIRAVPGTEVIEAGARAVRLAVTGPMTELFRAVAPYGVQDVRTHEADLVEAFLSYYPEKGDGSDDDRAQGALGPASQSARVG